MTTKQKETAKVQVPFLGLFYSGLGISLFTASIVAVTLRNLPPQLPLYYGLAEGESQLTSPVGLFIPSVVALAINLTNFFVTKVITDEYLQKVLLVSGLIVAIFATITTVKIIFLVGSF